MTIDQFIEALARIPNEWKYSRMTIRTAEGRPLCPIQAVARAVGVQSIDCNYEQEGRNIGLDWPDISRIVSAADACTGCDPKLRNRLLTACKMKPNTEVERAVGTLAGVTAMYWSNQYWFKVKWEEKQEPKLVLVQEVKKPEHELALV